MDISGRGTIVNLFDEVGDTVNLVGTVLNADGTGWSWVGSTAAGHVKTSEDSPTIITSFTIDTSTTGVFSATLTPTQTAGLGPGRFAWSIRVTTGSAVETWMSGALTLTVTA